MKVVVLTLVWMATQLGHACDYAKIDPQHSMCIFQPRACRGKRLFRSGHLSCQEKEQILKVHNELRQSLALGRIPRQPGAFNMMEMVWDEELAQIAQRWADQCLRGHDKSRNVERFRVGQNVAITWSLNKEPPTGEESNFPRLIKAWFNEVVEFEPRHIEPFVFTKKLGHYTQMAWAETYRVGCGFTYFREAKRGFTKMYVCNYGPGGNIIQDKMYKTRFNLRDNPCDPGHSNSLEYPGLCRHDSLDYGQTLPSCDSNHLISESNQLTPEKDQAGPHMMMELVRHSTRMFMNGLRPLMRIASTFNPFQLFNRFQQG